MSADKQDYIKILQKSLNDLKKMQKSLDYSLKKFNTIGQKEFYIEEEEGIIDNLVSRFSRLTDYLINKVYRNLDQIEYSTGGNLLDLFNRVHKRNLINSVAELKELKELRNITAHEYTDEDLHSICATVIKHIPILFNLIDRVIIYCKKTHGCL